MITSPEPWSIECKPDGFTYIKDFNGELIAKFVHANDAEFVKEVINESRERVKSLENEIEVLESKLEEAENRIKETKDKIEQTKKIL